MTTMNAAIIDDEITNASVTIDVSHHEIHEQEHYIAHSYLTAQTTHDVLVVTPNTTKRIHLMFEAVASSTALFQVFAECTATASATAVTAYNNDRNSDHTATLVLTQTPTSVTAGTKILYTGILAAGTRVAASARSDWELILKQNTKYLFRVTASPAVDSVIRFAWYEEG